MSTLDDLLSQRRRGPLSDADERRVQIGVKSSRDHQLALLAGEAFDRAGAPQAGDTELVRKIVRQVEGEWSGTFQRQVPRLQGRRRPKWSRWAAVPTLIAGVAAASWGGERLLQSLRAPARSEQQDPPRQAQLDPARQAQLDPARQASLASSASAAAPLVPATSDGAAASAAGVAPGARVAVPSTSRALPPDVVSRDTAARDTAAQARTARSSAAAARASSAPLLLRPAAARAAAGSEVPSLEDESARGLFLRANRLRRDDWAAAAGLYEQLTRRFAASTEAGVAEMALGKHALDEGHPDHALSWFRAYQQRPGGELKSEALWGEARSLESLGEAAAARAVWRRLITEYPASAYATVARQQLGF